MFLFQCQLKSTAEKRKEKRKYLLNDYMKEYDRKL